MCYITFGIFLLNSTLNSKFLYRSHLCHTSTQFILFDFIQSFFFFFHIGESCYYNTILYCCIIAYLNFLRICFLFSIENKKKLLYSMGARSGLTVYEIMFQVSLFLSPIDAMEIFNFKRDVKFKSYPLDHRNNGNDRLGIGIKDGNNIHCIRMRSHLDYYYNLIFFLSRFDAARFRN